MEKNSVLLADDSKMMRRLYSHALKDSEFNVVSLCEDGQMAIEEYEKNPTEFIILDIVMPNATGIDALRGIMAINPDVKAIMMSSVGTEENVAECLTIGAKSFVQKPINEELLLSTLREYAS